VSLTAHGFIWHGILLFISLLITMTGSADSSAKGILRAAGLFALLCIAAVMINACVEPVMQNIRSAHPAVLHSWAAMFYLNPYHISPQPLVGSIQITAGIPAGLVLYALAIASLASFLQSLHRSLLNLRH
jgi:TRAP-type C4-dicarboxylate transport system permease small subunit